MMICKFYSNFSLFVRELSMVHLYIAGFQSRDTLGLCLVAHVGIQFHEICSLLRGAKRQYV